RPKTKREHPFSGRVFRAASDTEEDIISTRRPSCKSAGGKSGKRGKQLSQSRKGAKKDTKKTKKRTADGLRPGVYHSFFSSLLVFLCVFAALRELSGTSRRVARSGVAHAADAARGLADELHQFRDDVKAAQFLLHASQGVGNDQALAEQDVERPADGV